MSEPISLLFHFQDLADPRIDRTKQHKLIDVIAITICAVMAGADGWDEIEMFAKYKEHWLRKYLELPNGYPSADTYRRVMERINPIAFQECFYSWVSSVFKDEPDKTIAIDGKRLRGAKDPIHIVSAWIHGNEGLCLGQVSTEEKSNEITAIPHLLNIMGIKGALITIDAMGCQKEITELIISNEADYLIAVKANQPELYQSVTEVFSESGPEFGIPFDFEETSNQSHGRTEKRRVTVCNDIDWFPCLSRWPGLKSIVMVESWRTLKGKSSKKESRFYISSRKLDPQKAGRAIRGHWEIENKLHWVMDVAFNEDKSKISNQTSAENLAAIRRLSMNLLKRVKTKNDSYPKMRKRCSWDDGFLLEVLLS